MGGPEALAGGLWASYPCSVRAVGARGLIFGPRPHTRHPRDRAQAPAPARAATAPRQPTPLIGWV